MTRSMLVLALAAGCHGPTDAGGDTDTVDSDVHETDGERPDFVPCSDATTTLTVGDAGALGFSGQDVLDATALSTSRTADYTADEGGGSTVVHVEVTSRGDPVFHARAPVEDTDADTDLVEGPPLGAPDEGGCPDWLEVPVTVHLLTDDGGFDETVDTVILAMDLANLSVSGELAWDDLGGTFTLQGLDPAAWDTVSMDFGSAWTPDGLAGQVNVQASSEAGDGVGVGYTGPVLIWPGG